MGYFTMSKTGKYIGGHTLWHGGDLGKVNHNNLQKRLKREAQRRLQDQPIAEASTVDGNEHDRSRLEQIKELRAQHWRLLEIQKRQKDLGAAKGGRRKRRKR